MTRIVSIIQTNLYHTYLSSLLRGAKRVCIEVTTAF